MSPRRRFASICTRWTQRREVLLLARSLSGSTAQGSLRELAEKPFASTTTEPIFGIAPLKLRNVEDEDFVSSSSSSSTLPRPQDPHHNYFSQTWAEQRHGPGPDDPLDKTVHTSLPHHLSTQRSAPTRVRLVAPDLQFSTQGVQRYLLKEGSVFGLQWHQKMSRSISTFRAPLLNPPSTQGKEQPVPSPLTMVPTPSDPSKKNPAEIDKKRSVQAVLKKIKESPKKVNLVAALVRGMQVQDALLQLAVLQKRAAKTVKRVVANARANATHNHGLNGERLFVAEAFVGKGKYLKRLSYHAKGRSGIMHHPSCRLTVVVKELSDEQEAEIARYKIMTFRERAQVKTRLIPHKLIETTPRWHRTSKESSGVLES